jgi:hypothetical protein
MKKIPSWTGLPRAILRTREAERLCAIEAPRFRKPTTRISHSAFLLRAALPASRERPRRTVRAGSADKGVLRWLGEHI